jgi:glycosyltransferase involved in cell wall biosynthesis
VRSRQAEDGSLFVLHVTQPSAGGAAKVVLDLAADQVGRGWRVAVAGPPLLAPAVLERGASHIAWEAGRNPGPGVVIETAALAGTIRRANPELVHLHSSKAGLAGRLAMRGRRPTVFQPHGWSFEAVEGALRTAAVGWERLAARWADAVICVSEAERSRGMDVGVRAQWRVVPNGVDLEHLSEATAADRAAARRRLGLAEARLVVCVGRLSRAKGQDLLLDAWPLVANRLPAARLVLVGDGEDREALARRAHPGIELVGARDDVADWLAAADVVAAPSRWDAMSLVVLEAMARGRSVVATDAGGVREALGTDAGAVVPAGDAEAFARALLERLLNSEQAAAEGRSGRVRAERLFDVSRTSEEIAALYREVVGRRPSAVSR